MEKICTVYLFYSFFVSYLSKVKTMYFYRLYDSIKVFAAIAPSIGQLPQEQFASSFFYIQTLTIILSSF